jgi:hypothetical protein
VYFPELTPFRNEQNRANMSSRKVILLIFLVMCLMVPVCAHVPVISGDNNNIGGATVINNPGKTYVFYGEFHENGEVAYYRMDLKPGDQFSVSLMNAGMDSPVPDMAILSPNRSQPGENIPRGVNIPEGYGEEIIPGARPAGAEYEPFAPSVIFTVGRYSQTVTVPGAYYIAVISPANDTAYSIATGHREEFSVSEWVMVPFSVIRTRVWEGQSIPDIFAPFFAITVIGAIMVMRRERKKGTRPRLAFWLATSAGLCYLGGASVTFVQMIHALEITGFSPGAGITLILVVIPAFLGFIALRLARGPVPRSVQDRLFIAGIGGLGLAFWAGFFIGPVMAVIAALVPDPPGASR